MALALKVLKNTVKEAALGVVVQSASQQNISFQSWLY